MHVSWRRQENCTRPCSRSISMPSRLPKDHPRAAMACQTPCNKTKRHDNTRKENHHKAVRRHARHCPGQRNGSEHHIKHTVCHRKGIITQGLRFSMSPLIPSVVYNFNGQQQLSLVITFEQKSEHTQTRRKYDNARGRRQSHGHNNWDREGPGLQTQD